MIMHSYRSRQFIIGLCVVFITMLAGCAGSIPAAPKDQRAAEDPWEPLNRRIYNFNTGFDNIALKPLAKGYGKITPEFAKKGVGNFSRNLLAPRNIINNLLQGKPGRAMVEFGRFLTNTTFGIGGLFDPATSSGLEAYPERFGETFAVWGVADGPYVVMPFLGPGTVSDAFGVPLGFLSDPVFHLDDNSTKWIIYGIRYIDLRERLFAAEDALFKDSFDRYLTIRESYLQNRRFRVYDGDPPEDEDFYDEFLDEEIE